MVRNKKNKKSGSFNPYSSIKNVNWRNGNIFIKSFGKKK